MILWNRWGTSPRLSESSGGGFVRRIVGARRIIRGLPVAALVVVVVVFAAFMQMSSSAYAWNSMLEALGQAGVVQVESHGALYWLSIHDRVAGESDRGVSTVVDANRMLILRCDESGSAVEQKTVGVVRDQQRKSVADLSACSVAGRSGPRCRTTTASHSQASF